VIGRQTAAACGVRNVGDDWIKRLRAIMTTRLSVSEIVP